MNLNRPSLIQVVKISLSILADFKFVKPTSSIVEGHFHIHENLIDVICLPFFVNYDRFCELSVLTDCNIAFPNDVYLEAMLIPLLNYFTTVACSMSKAYHKVTYEVLLTPIQQRLQFFDKRAKESLYN